jgi:hypothetical protein
MTNKCIKKVDALQQESEAFNDLSVEQLLYSAIIGTSYEDVKFVLENTDWSKYCPNIHKQI